MKAKTFKQPIIFLELGVKFGDFEIWWSRYFQKKKFKGKFYPQKNVQPLGNIHPYDDEE